MCLCVSIQQPDLQNLQKLIQPLAGVITKAFNLTEGRRSDAYNHLKTVAESMAALSWVVYTGKECGELLLCCYGDRAAMWFLPLPTN